MGMAKIFAKFGKRTKIRVYILLGEVVCAFQIEKKKEYRKLGNLISEFGW